MQPRDVQRRKVYAWENSQKWMDKSAISTIHWNHLVNVYSKSGATPSPRTVAMGRKAITSLVARAYKHMNAHPDCTLPEIRFKSGKGRATGCSHAISLPMWSRTPSVVLHEAAHALQPNYTTAWHGPEFMAIYIELVSHFLGESATGLAASARAYGLQVGAFLAPKATAQGSKRCSVCEALKDISEFASDKSAKDGRYSSCKDCGRERRRTKSLTSVTSRSMVVA